MLWDACCVATRHIGTPLTGIRQRLQLATGRPCGWGGGQHAVHAGLTVQVGMLGGRRETGGQGLGAVTAAERGGCGGDLGARPAPKSPEGCGMCAQIPKEGRGMCTQIPKEGRGTCRCHLQGSRWEVRRCTQVRPA